MKRFFKISVFTFVLFIVGCQKDAPQTTATLPTPTPTPTPVHFIGEKFQGGKIFYLTTDGKNGIISALTDASYVSTWANNGLLYNISTKIELGTGYQNTMNIISAQGAGYYAAYFANGANDGGYNDWFLPSIDELQQLYNNKDKVGGFLKGAYPEYWSSSVSTNGSTAIYTIDFTTGKTYLHDRKKNNANVRAVRYF